MNPVAKGFVLGVAANLAATLIVWYFFNRERKKT